jgi:arginyl-tRNA synthetase
MFKEFRKQASNALGEVLKEQGISEEVVFSIPTVEMFGDLSTNICFQLAPILKKAPNEIAKSLVIKIKTSDLLKEVKAEGGYLNFYIHYPNFSKHLLKIVRDDFGKGEKKEKVIVEHTSANPDGPLHIGHLRNAVIGDTLARILRFAGYETEVHYYLNDMGKQTAKVVWGMRKFKVGGGKKDQATAEVYIKANREIEEKGLDEELSNILSLYEKGEKKTVDEFKRAVEFCLEGIIETLTRLGINHDKFIWESNFVRGGSVKKVVEDLQNTEYSKKEGKATIIDLGEFGIEKEMVVTRNDGTTLYIARDLAHHIWKMKQGRGLNIWGADHKLMSEQLKAGLTILGYNIPEFIIHEFISLPEGSMSTRKGVFISSDHLIDETVKKALTEIMSRRPDMDKKTAENIAEYVGIGAVRFNIERIAPEKAMIFRWEEALDFERQGSPFIQYAYARGKKILIKAGEKEKSVVEIKPRNEERRLINIISRFPEIVEEAADSRKASVMATYAIELSNAFHSFYMVARVIDSDTEQFRVSLVNATVIVLGRAMELLGIKHLDDM